MATNRAESRKHTRAKSGARISLPRVSRKRIDEMIEEATVDAYNESEQFTGFFTVIEDNLKVPFKTNVLGVEVTVIGVDLTEADEIVAICKRGRERQAIPLLALPLPSPPPIGHEWIQAFRYWRRGH